MTRFHCAHRAGGSWQELARGCARELGSGEANLAFLYATEPLAGDLGAIESFLRKNTGIPYWVGAVGPGICATGREYFDTPAISVLACALPADSFRVLPSTTEATVDSLGDLASWIAEKQPAIGLVHADPSNPKVVSLIPTLARATGCFLVGALTSGAHPEAQLAGQPTGGGISGLLLGGAVAVATGLTQGCSPIGPWHEVSEADRNVLISLDERPALEVFHEDIGPELAADPRRVAGHVHAALPVAGSDTGDYLVRNLVGIDPAQGWVAAATHFNTGDRVMFVRRDPASAAADMDRMLERLRERAGARPRAGVYFSCVARGPNQFGPDSAELMRIRDRLGDFPLAGFFGNGEISHDRLYTYTGVLTLFTGEE
ncbi:MAG: FIST N-terminal domain-containing protein [Alphaproteobacteria bacterium]